MVMLCFAVLDLLLLVYVVVVEVDLQLDKS